MIKINPLLKSFISVAKNKSVHLAAQELSLTQTAVSQRIKNLEKNLNSSLFIRSRRGMQLTQEGQILLRYCNDIEQIETQCLEDLGQQNKSSSIFLKISSDSTGIRTLILPFCQKLIKQYPQLKFNLQISDKGDQHEKLKSGSVDLAIIPKEYISKDMSYKPLKPQKYVLIIPAHWQKRDIKDIIISENIIDFDSNDKVTFNYLKKIGLFELCNKERHCINAIDQLVEFVNSGIGYSVITEQLYQQYYQSQNIIAYNPQLLYEHQLGLCWYDRGILPNYFKSMIDLIE